MRERFVAEFGEDAALAVERAANEHANGINSERKGADPFRWALLICIGYECMSRDGFRKDHGFAPEWSAVDAWMRQPDQRAAFSAHDGDCDYLALMGGAYNCYMPEQPTKGAEA